MRLAVFDGAVGPEEIRHVVAGLGDKERVTVVAQAVLPETEELLTELSKGSSLMLLLLSRAVLGLFVEPVAVAVGEVVFA